MGLPVQRPSTSLRYAQETRAGNLSQSAFANDRPGLEANIPCPEKVRSKSPFESKWVNQGGLEPLPLFLE
jgi:hypothetical protein